MFHSGLVFFLENKKKLRDDFNVILAENRNTKCIDLNFVDRWISENAVERL